MSLDLIPQDLKARLLRCLTGLDDDQKLAALARLVNPAIIRAKVMNEPVESAQTTCFTDLRADSETTGIRFSDQDEQLIRRCGLDPAAVAGEIVRLREEKARQRRMKEGTVELSDQDVQELRRLGHTPEDIVTALKAENASQYATLKGDKP